MNYINLINLFVLFFETSFADTQETIRQGRFFFGDLDLFFSHSSDNKGYNWDGRNTPRDPGFIGSQQLNTFRDSFGEFFYGLNGNQVYLQCFDKYRYPNNHCQGKSVYFPVNRPQVVQQQISSIGPYKPNYEDAEPGNTNDVDFVEVSADEARRYRPYYGRFDGRGNVNVGRGIYEARGKDVEINCDFPREKEVRRIVWCKVPSYDRSSWKDESNRGRLRVKRLGRSSTKLIIRNFKQEQDSGTYRCFGLRNRDQGLEPIYMETDVRPIALPAYFTSYRN
ncbi:uncharacterized protein [Lepeophtheirus salmonis]|uniref:uncharacterized protein n=1 Tax=Lepeophtheirus salmonis TaxID=72036 RepID=UPI001AE2A655|nr:uncharacterized protein LOC121121653 [Lepeophtheirus salmonis]